MKLNPTIVEALQIKPLTEEEKNKRHILGRLYGRIATCKENTRNGRRYNKELWERALADELLAEKIKNKCLFLELGHPTDREETDMSKVCACIPEFPKIIDDDLYAYVDILDTTNGRLLKTLCDYGFTPGISSRGSGDIMANNEVDPETFYLETFDIVQIPAVQSARLECLTESLKNKKSLSKALVESLENASAEDQTIMKETLDALNIEVEDNIEFLPDPDSDDAQQQLIEADDNTANDADSAVSTDTEEKIDDTVLVDTAEETVTSLSNVGEFIQELSNYDPNLPLEFTNIKIDDREIPIENIILDTDDENKLSVEIICKQESKTNNETEVENIEPVADAEPSEDVSKETDEVSDTESDEILESLKEAIRIKSELTQEIRSLNTAKAVSDAEVKELKEDLAKYKSAFARTSVIAATVKTTTAENKQLTEQLAQKTKELTEAKENNSKCLTEDFHRTQKQILSLKEQLTAKDSELLDLAEQKDTQIKLYKTKLKESINVATSYKKQCTEAINKYISFRADILGISPSEIINKLREQYTISDIDQICESILTQGLTFSRLPQGMTNTARVKINEVKPKMTSVDSGYEIDDSLLDLAGLK